MSVLNAIHLGKSYSSRRVVDDVSLDVSSGQVVGLLGPNGAGKTTCFYMIVGLVPCGEGRIELDNVDLTTQPILEIRKDLNKANRKELLDSLLHELHIGHLIDQPGVSLSGGERRRVEIARALAADPRFILLDEPFAGVDPISVVDIQRIIEHLCDRNIGVLITDHNVREMLGICHHAYILNAGKVIAAGTPEEVLNDQHVRDVYLGSEFRL
jgi:lipopolysaccharide export system ATP-binding protein